MKKALILSTLTTLFLTGCSQYQEEYDCSAGKGIGCKSITEVKKMLNQGEIDIPESTTETYQGRGATGKMTIMSPVINNVPSKGVSPISFMDSSGMLIQRTPEKPLRIWIAPYQDSEGNLREASVVHTVVQGGYWKMSPEAVS